MNSEKYTQVYKELGITIEPLPANYTPDEFGRRLHSMSQTEVGVSYAASTDYVDSSKKTLDLIKE